MMRYCRSCSEWFEAEDGVRQCPLCGALLDEIAGPSPGVKKNTPEERYTPWEDKGKLGFFASLYETWKESIFHPTAFYRRMPLRGGIGNPLLYGLILALIGFIFQSFYDDLFRQMFDFSQWFGTKGSEFGEFSERLRSMSDLSLIVLFPFIQTAAFFVWSGLVHLALLLFGWSRQNYEATFRLVAYSEGPSFFLIVPFVGSLVGIVWQLALVVTGVREVHRTTTEQALLVVLLPLVLCCLCCCGAIWVIVMAGIS